MARATSERSRIDEDRLDPEPQDVGARQECGAAAVLTIADRDRRREDRQSVNGSWPDAEQAGRHEGAGDNDGGDGRDRGPDPRASEIQPHGPSTPRRRPMRRV